MADIIKQLRSEGNDVKECFTRFSFQAFALTAIILGVLIEKQIEEPLVGFASCLVIILILAVARIGTYKYTTANRNYGYELHLNRTKNSPLKPVRPDGWRKEWREVGWEEAMRAWRIVQAAVFRHLYVTSKLLPAKLRYAHRAENYKWYAPTELLKSKGVEYYAGTYLRTMLAVCHLIAGLALIPMIVMCLQLESKGEPRVFIFAVAVTTIFAIVVIWRVMRDRARLEILERGLLCIHSAGILWQAVITAHFRAKDRAHQRHQSWRDYTTELAIEANKLKNNLYDIHDWVK